MERLNKRIIAWCIYCHDPIYEGDGCRFVPEKGWVHYDTDDPLNNCYFPEGEDEE